MARPLRIEFPNALYHVTSRGNARQKIFLNDYDRKDFLKILGIAVARFHWLVYAYCLMDNHYHIVVETPDANLSRGMRQLNGEYAQLFNWWHKKIGHVFQGRYKAILVEKESYFLEVCRYVVLNPVRARVVLGPEKWKWSSYGATLGKDKPVRNLTADVLLGHFGTDQRSAIREYKEFINDGINGPSIWDDLKGQIILGDDDFVDRISRMLDRDKEDMIEIPRVQRYVGRPLLEDLFRNVANMDKYRVQQLTHEAYHNGYTMQQIAKQLGVHYATVSRWIRQAEDNM